MDYFIVMLPARQQGQNFEKAIGGMGLRACEPKKFPLPAFKIGTLDSLMENSDDLNKMDMATEGSLQKILATGEQLYMEGQDKGSAKKVRQELQVVKVTERVAQSPHPVEKTKNVKSYVENWHWDVFRYTDHSDVSIKKVLEEVSRSVAVAEDVIKRKVAEYAELKSKCSAAEKRVGGNLMVKDITTEVAAWNRKRSSPLPEELLRRRAADCTETTKMCMLFVAMTKRDEELWSDYASWGISDEDISAMDQIKEGETDHIADGVTLGRIRFKYNGQIVDTSNATATNPGGSQQGCQTYDNGLPANIIDGDAGTAWFDSNSKPIVIDFHAPTPVDQFSLTTGMDAPHRDPVQWTLEGYVPAPEGAHVPSVTIDLQGVGSVTVAQGESEADVMKRIHQKLGVGPGKRIILKEEGLPVQGVFDQLEEGAAYTYVVEDAAGREYSKASETIDLGSWKIIQPTRTDFHMPTQRRTDTEFLRIQKPADYTRYRFTPTVMRGHPQRGPIPCGNGSVPGTSEVVKRDGDYLLMSVMVFSNLEGNFKNLCRDRKLVVREYSPPSDQSPVSAKEEFTMLEAKRKEKRQELLREVGVQFSEAYTSWIHIKAVRAFVEAILRYGLPANYVSALFCCDSKNSKSEEEMRAKLQNQYGDLAPKGVDLGEDVSDMNALQEKYPYVSLRIPSLDQQ
eukprot:TRINITY_DN32090_c0_g1_i1.p1 TRINITY_DN32090_c0_g1~~TRINITY_DN32090_c0_g1_i1.p1  ORF type:complete len:696 (+),score=286.48 TRINITY_DN32090_c0_g1_i1:49-2088(+)